MKNKYKEYIQSQNKFNKWEEDFIRNLPVDEKLDQFVELFNLKPKNEILQAKHLRHLNNLINERKYIKSRIQHSTKLNL